MYMTNTKLEEKNVNDENVATPSNLKMMYNLESTLY